MTIRFMRPEDHRQLVELWSGSPGNAVTRADSYEEFSEFLARNGEFCFTAVDRAGDGILHAAGSVMAGSDGRRGYVYHLAVREDLRGRGLGGRLMRSVEEALKRSGLEKIHLFIYRDNPAVAFYEKMEWHVRHDILVMSRVLEGPGQDRNKGR
jgi:ribosomal protein S18 acetylase RimI-like enzyme